MAIAKHKNPNLNFFYIFQVYKKSHYQVTCFPVVNRNLKKKIKVENTADSAVVLIQPSSKSATKI